MISFKVGQIYHGQKDIHSKVKGQCRGGTAVLAKAAREQGVAYVGGRAFHFGRGGQQTVRLAFSHVSDQEIPEAILRFGRALEQAAGGAAT